MNGYLHKLLLSEIDALGVDKFCEEYGVSSQTLSNWKNGKLTKPFEIAETIIQKRGIDKKDETQTMLIGEDGTLQVIITDDRTSQAKFRNFTLWAKAKGPLVGIFTRTTAAQEFFNAVIPFMHKYRVGLFAIPKQEKKKESQCQQDEPTGTEDSDSSAKLSTTQNEED